MSIKNNNPLEQLAELWIEASPDALRRIPMVCERIAQVVSGGTAGEIDLTLLRRVKLLASRAENRIAECVTIQTRTGGYSTHGGLEVARRIATSGWEG